MSLNLKATTEKINMGEIPWWSSGWDSLLSPLRAQVQSLVGELRSCHSQKKKKNQHGILKNIQVIHKTENKREKKNPEKINRRTVKWQT